jgi:hypothetical protein
MPPAYEPVERLETLSCVEASSVRSLIRSAAFSAIMMVAAFVFARVIVGITDASTTRRPSTPYTRKFGSTTEPIAHVEVG